MTSDTRGGARERTIDGRAKSPACEDVPGERRENQMVLRYGRRESGAHRRDESIHRNLFSEGRPWPLLTIPCRRRENLNRAHRRIKRAIIQVSDWCTSIHIMIGYCRLVWKR